MHVREEDTVELASLALDSYSIMSIWELKPITKKCGYKSYPTTLSNGLTFVASAMGPYIHLFEVRMRVL